MRKLRWYEVPEFEMTISGPTCALIEDGDYDRGIAWPKSKRPWVNAEVANGCCFCNGQDRAIPGHIPCEIHSKMLCAHGELFTANCEACVRAWFEKLIDLKRRRLI